ncbi:FUN14 domain-containing protein 1-like isoform X1 [Mizuhopecten yessoensis]|uniref:FUN14 domain-containing protein 1-like isoform X1 n=1 Tax=Mizuhopecten yessoensis TaxID=6573 RepID=UPI000B457934|nr:FUN14 domain-containing protein 1-like isoform X1 [Mizuhopecten yessoensis]
MANDNEPFEVLDLDAIRRGNSWIQSVFGDISRQSAAKQVAIGGATGWISGYLFVKVGKIAAATLGTTIILVQIAQYKGYIKIDWKKVQKEMNLAKNQMSKEISKKYPHYSQNMQTFFKQNIFLGTGFAGGFLIGMAF